MDVFAAGNSDSINQTSAYEQRITELSKELQDSIGAAQNNGLLAERYQGEVALLEEQLSSRRFYSSNLNNIF